MLTQTTPTTVTTAARIRVGSAGPAGAVRAAGRAAVVRAEDDRPVDRALVFERLVGEEPVRPDPERERGGAGVRVAMVRG